MGGHDQKHQILCNGEFRKQSVLNGPEEVHDGAGVPWIHVLLFSLASDFLAGVRILLA